MRVWTFAEALVEARYRTMQIHWNTHDGVIIEHAGQCALIATPQIPTTLPIYDGEFPIITKAVWSSGFPVELAVRAIETYCPVGGVVFDPFMGMATTAIGAIQTGRRWVGCETEWARIDQAYERIRRETGWGLDAVH
jgi:DNA modification methylase